MLISMFFMCLFSPALASDYSAQAHDWLVRWVSLRLSEPEQRRVSLPIQRSFSPHYQRESVR
jgi:hypothetical protein